MNDLEILPNDPFDGFSVRLRFDEARQQWTATLAEIEKLEIKASSPEAALSDLVSAWQFYKASCTKADKPIPIAASHKKYSGSFNVRIDRRLHRALAMEAVEANLSLNALVAQKLIMSTKF